ncbi:hypothetical protein ACSFE6_01170 [Pseudomonas baetica]
MTKLDFPSMPILIGIEKAIYIGIGQTVDTEAISCKRFPKTSQPAVTL